ncbi:MAG: galactose/methyl galactoside ABC transporter permease MglC [Synergistaceae bacterium]|jgi:methyl-galactoside transport system permease protein|nr:galactose/methyl galactoside ABC transporter permease MglC [Synergistaceae bacterium]
MSKIGRFALNYAIYIVLFALLATIVMFDKNFLSFRNFGFILSQASTRIILALGIAGIIVSGNTDLSLGRSVGLAALVACSLLQNPTYVGRIYATMPQLPLWLPLLAAMLLCAFFSVLQSLVVGVLKVAPFIASLGFQLILFGVQSLYFDAVNNSSPIGGLDPAFSRFAQGAFNIWGIRLPYLVLYALLTTAVVWIVWNKTKLGKNMFAIGGNAEAASVSGVSIVKNLIMIYFIAGLLYGFGGALEGARTGSATNVTGQSYELDAIAACVVGGVSMRGGIGSIIGVITGVLIFQVINYGLVFIGVNPYVQYTIKGFIIILAVSIDTQKYLKKK